jgi:cytochrome c oxidase cbb3-type subunit 3
MNPSIGCWRNGKCAVIGLVVVLAIVPFVKGLADDRTGENTGNESLPTAAQEQDDKRLVAARCAVCHSTDLIVQQRLTREQWIATVRKMAHWGAQMSSAEETQLVDYLAAHYHPSASAGFDLTAQDSPDPTITEPATLAGVPQHPVGQVDRGQKLFGQNCMPCHGPAAAGGMGPTLAKNPVLIDERRFWDTVRQGRGAMPAWGSMLTAQEIADIQAWLKTLE